MNRRSALRPPLFAVLGAALLLTSCSTAGVDDRRTTDGRASYWEEDAGAPEASAFMEVAVPRSAREVKGAVQVQWIEIHVLALDAARTRVYLQAF